ncbi:MAG: peptidylprolyl isomerase [Spirochaetes bacterium]|nr:peptidylprolyl isomerase [Spirochaetota bacterium]
MKNKLAWSAVFLCLLPVKGEGWELFDRVIAVVNDRPILESEVHQRFERFIQIQQKKGKKIPPSKFSYHKSRVLDSFIEDSLFEQMAEEESIIVSDEKIDDHIEKLMKRYNISSLNEFKNKIEKSENMSFEEYREQVRKSIIREMVMSLAVGVNPPSEQQAQEWYKKNIDKVGYEFNINHIFLRLRNKTIAEERRVNNEMKAILAKINSGMSFEEAAKRFSEDVSSKGKGGALGWVKLHEIDRLLAMQIFGMNKGGQLSGIIKSGEGYHIVKFNGKRPVPFESIKDIIFSILYNERMNEQMEKWAEHKRKESDVKIFMDDYVLN